MSPVQPSWFGSDLCLKAKQKVSTMLKRYMKYILTDVEQYYDECGEMEGYRQKQVSIPSFGRVPPQLRVR